MGIKLFSDGVLVVGLAEVGTKTEKASPAKECGLRVGDIFAQLFVELHDELLGWQVVVLHWIHVGIMNIQGTIGSLLQMIGFALFAE